MTEARLRWRLRLFSSSLLLAAVAFVQSPGRIVGDTKYDLVARPGLFLDKVLHLWDPIGNFGQVQNQAYGYLFPMGPFFLIGDLAQVPGWVVQRAWWAVVLIVAFLGIVKLCGVLQIGSPWTRILAGFAFALSPRMLTNLGPISIENWPSAVAPWVLIPLVIGAQRGSARQAAARSGFAAAFVGGVNAVASAAILPISALWLLTRRRGHRRGTMMRWWPVFVGLATLWWIVPLLVLGRFSPPFLDYIESAQATTAPATIVDALRGTTKWVPYVDPDYSAGRELLADPLVILQSGLLVIMGLLGLARRDLPERRFLVLSVMGGVILVTLGHLGSVEGQFAGSLNDALDGVLAPLRNTHKWDVMIRLPLVLGLAHLLAVLGTKVVDGRRELLQERAALRLGVGALAVAAFVGTATVAWSAGLASSGTFDAPPKYWTSAAAWLESHDDGRRTYVTPGAAFGDYVWGRPMDEAIQALSAAPWATRSVIPLVPGSNIRMMDAIESRMVDGKGSAGLHDYLVRSGVGRIVVRNDLRTSDTSPSQARVYAAIATTPGLVKVASFGPSMGGDTRLDQGDRSAVFVDDGRQSRHRAIEIFEVETDSAGRAQGSVVTPAQLPLFIGDSASLLQALEMGAVGDGPVQFARDTGKGVDPDRVVLTDGTRRQEVEYGKVHDNRSASLARSEEWQSSRPIHDYATGRTDRWLAVPELRGAKSLTATSSASSVGYLREIDKSQQPFSAIDGDPDTAWVSGQAVNGRHRLTLTLDSPRRVGTLTLRSPDADKASPRTVTVTTATGTVTTRLTPGDSTRIRTRPGTTDFVSVTATSDLGQPLRISELTVPGVSVSRPLVLPTYPEAWGSPAVIALGVDAGERPGCLVVDGDTRCAADNERLSEDGRTLDRIVTLPDAETYRATLQVSPWGTKDLDDLIQVDRDAVVVASSQATHDAGSGGVAAFDADRRTGWVASPADRDPSLSVAWDEPQRIDSITAYVSDGLVASSPTRAVLDFGKGVSRTVELRNGRAAFKPVRADGVRVRFTSNDSATSISLDGQSGRELPVGVSELSFGGSTAGPARLSATAVDWGCGSGPSVQADGRTRRSAVVASPDAVFRGETLTARLCGTGGTVRLDSGANRLVAKPSGAFRPVSLRLRREPLAAVSSASAKVDEDAAVTSVRLPAGADEGLLVLKVNQNVGWSAHQDGASLKPVTVDGWQQGWLLSGGSSSVDLHFGPDTVYRLGLFGGVLGALVVALAAWVRRRGGGHRADDPALVPARSGLLTGPLLVAAFALIVAGVPGVVVAGIGMAAATVLNRPRLRRRAAWATGLVVSVSMATVFAAYAIRPWGTEFAWMGSRAWPQLVGLGVLVLVVSQALSPLDLRWLKRIAGRSTR